MSSEINKTIADIPVKVIVPEVKRGGANIRWRRRFAQGIFLLLIVLIPVTGLFRFDPENGALVILGWQIWLSDFFLVTGLWIMLACALIALYSVAGTVFCGWACPQNSMAEWANYMTRKLLGKRAEVSLNGDAPIVAAAKNKPLNWTILGISFLLAAMFFALIPLLYFYPPDVVLSFIIFRDDARLAGSLHWIYTVWVMIILLDISVLRHFWCRFACVYKVWQHSFKTKETLHVAYDDSRASECAKCNYCATSCFIDLDPKKTQQYDSCINCGDCIDACNSLQAKKGKVGLLRFELGARAGKVRNFRDNTMSLLSRFQWTAPFALLGAIMFAWGVWSYEPYHLSVGYLETIHNRSATDYRIEVSNKRYQTGELVIDIDGLPQNSYKLDTSKVEIGSVGRVSAIISVSPKLQRGFHPFSVIVRSVDGWTGRFRVQHYVD